MKIIYFFILLLIGILLYQILNNICKCNLKEGYGNFGRVHLDKCCPRGYKYSKERKECIELCRGCGPSAYNKLKFKFEAWHSDKEYGGGGGETLHAYFDCDEHDAKNIYDYDSINKIYTKGEQVSQYDGFDGDDSGVKASEEGDNEAWAGISGDAANRHDGEWHDANIGADIYPFEAISKELYYTNQEECNSDYDKNKTIPGPNKNITIPNNNTDNGCLGYWKLDLENPNITYLKDDNTKIFTAPFVITKNAPNKLGISTSQYHSQNASHILNIVKDLHPESPVTQYYNRFLEEYALDDILNNNRTTFCTNLSTSIDDNKDTPFFTDNDDYKYNNLCEEGEEGEEGEDGEDGEVTTTTTTNSEVTISNDNWDSLCGESSLTTNPTFTDNELCNASKNDDTKLRLCENNKDLFCSE